MPRSLRASDFTVEDPDQLMKPAEAREFASRLGKLGFYVAKLSSWPKPNGTQEILLDEIEEAGITEPISIDIYFAGLGAGSEPTGHNAAQLRRTLEGNDLAPTHERFARMWAMLHPNRSFAEAQASVIHLVSAAINDALRSRYS